MYTTINFKTKKELKERVALYLKYKEEGKFDGMANTRVTYYQPNSDVTGFEAKQNGTIYIEGPHFPKPHKWYAECEAKDGIIVKVK